MNQFFLPPLSRVNKGLLIVFVGTFILQTLLELGGLSLVGFLGLSGAKFFSGHIYQLFTFPILPNGFLGLLFNGLVLWFFGSELEDRWGIYRYCQFMVVTLLGQACIYLGIMSLFFSGSTLFYYPLVGPAGFCTTLCVAYGILFPNRTMYLYLFPVKAKWFVAIVVVMSLYQALPSKGGVYAWAQLGAMLSGFLWMVLVSSKEGWLAGLKAWLKLGPSRLKGSKGGGFGHPGLRKKSHLRIVSDSDKSSDEEDRTYH